MLASTAPRRAGSHGRKSRHAQSVLRLVVLAAAAMARLQRRDGGRGALEMAGSYSVRAGLRCCLALRVGFWVDGARNTRPRRPAETVGGRRLLICAERHIRWLRGGLDRAMDRVRACEPSRDCPCGVGCPRRAPVRCFL